MDFKDWYYSLTIEQRQQYSRRCGTSTAYIESHLAVNIARRRIPRPKKLAALAGGSNGEISMVGLLAYFYDMPELYDFDITRTKAA